MKQCLPLIQRWAKMSCHVADIFLSYVGFRNVPTFSLVHKNTEKKENIYFICVVSEKLLCCLQTF